MSYVTQPHRIRPVDIHVDRTVLAAMIEACKPAQWVVVLDGGGWLGPYDTVNEALEDRNRAIT